MALISLPRQALRGGAVLPERLSGSQCAPVNAVAPGPVATSYSCTGEELAGMEQAPQTPPLERLGQPEDIANLVSFLAGPDGGWVNGQVLRANGGFA